MKYAPLSLGTLLVLAAALPMGCGDDPPALGGTKQPAGDGDGDTGDGDADEEPCDQGDTQECSCSGKPGVQICDNGEWDRCDCTQSTMEDPSPTGMRCKAGYYTGSFHGKWRPGAFDLGGGLTLIDVQIDAKETDKGPGLALTLTKKEESGGEFPTFEVKNGCVTGTATAIGGIDSHPFVATLTGELDCKTGTFTGNMDGVYSLFDTGELSQWYFTGDFGDDAPKVPLTGHYYTETSKIDDGTWDLREKQTKPNELPGAGGEGKWEANWVSDDSPPLPQSCLDFINGVGVGGGEADAGT